MRKRGMGWGLLWVSILSVFCVAGIAQMSASQEVVEAAALENNLLKESHLRESRTDKVILADYFTQMQDLILSQGLRESEDGSEVEIIAKAITLNTVRTLSSEQNAVLIEFLDELNLLRQGMDDVDRFKNAGQLVYVGEHPKKLFSQADLSGAQLSNVGLSLSNLSQSNFSDSDLSNARLGSAKLAGADFSRADLTQADLGGAYLPAAKFHESLLVNTIFGSSNLERADFSGANLQDVGLFDLNLTDARFVDAHLAHVRFNASDLSNVDFSDAQMAVVGFRGANLSHANLSGHSPGKRFENTEYPTLDLTGANLTGTDFTNTDLRDAQVEEQQLKLSILCRTRLPRGFATDSDRDCSA